MKFTHCMIDLETLGTAPNAPVVAIGAVYFDPDTGTLGDTFDMAIDVEDAIKYGSVSGSTLKWWLGQSDAARQKVVRGTAPAPRVFEAFHGFCLKHGSDIRPWGNGSSFDITILEYAFDRILERPAPWKFWAVRDCRTIKELAEGIVVFDAKLEGVAHNALDDAKHQAKWVSAYWQGLRSKKATPAATQQTGFSREMQDALHADAEKLSGLTGEEHRVEFFDLGFDDLLG
ncbi:3'-5' exonuclease [Mesorhizobium sp. B2-1-2]|uniref:3'-5' exonuclease n=1 Tax=Mesorhizobium sp. B2-1-2 TaxID=2589973 RepID=UPI00112B3B8E|nr:3'-5' exonuclease [Mesorhizobium sp. B2-1-2]TPN04478.1 3'-5' exoribonuclease [Mesorhizobium sp. B2-1-2]